MVHVYRKAWARANHPVLRPCPAPTKGANVKRHLLLLAVTLVAALLGIGGSCRTHVTIVVVSSPQQVSTGDTAFVTLCSEVTSGKPVSVRYALDWGDETAETTRDYIRSADTIRLSHIWRRPGTYEVVASADEFDARTAAGGSTRITVTEARCTVVVDATGHEPVIDRFDGPEYTAFDMETRFTLIAHDPDNDSIKATFIWGDGDDTTSAFVASPCTMEITHEYTSTDTFWVRAFCTDVWGIESYADSIRLVVGPAGAVIGWWRGDEEEPWHQARSPAVVGSGERERIYIATDEGFGRVPFRQFSPYPGGSLYPGCFISHPSYSSATGHICAAEEEGQLYAFDTSLVPAWRYPDTITRGEWGSAAVKGNRLYVPRGDSIFSIVDNGLSATRQAAFGAAGELVDAPVIDATGNVYFGTDSGYLYKLGPDLSLLWRIRLLASGKVSGLALRSDGVLYCRSDSGRLYAVKPDSVVAWSVPTNGRGSRPAVGRDDNIYLGTETGWFSKYDRVTGTVLWEERISTVGLITTPVIVANLHLYVQDEDDQLYCLDQGDGDLVWACDCRAALPRPAPRGRRMQLNDFPPNPTILSDGNIVVVGQEAVYLVKGYPEGPLDPLAPWPKWQHDLHSTGNISGGR